MVRLSVLMMLVVGVGAFRVPKQRNASISIVNGGEAPQCLWTHLVGLYERNKGEPPFCGGSIIGQQWVLTAAHCLWGDIDVVAGDWNTGEESGWEQKQEAVEYHPHKEYCQKDCYKLDRHKHDIGLIKLKDPFEFTSCVGSVVLASRSIVAGIGCTITGWGLLETRGAKPTILQQASVTTISNFDCVHKYKYLTEEITSDMLCAGGLTATGDLIDACQEDSGSPLVCFDPDVWSWVLHGVTSWGYDCASQSHPGVWSRVYEHKEWITGIYPEAFGQSLQ